MTEATVPNITEKIPQIATLLSKEEVVCRLFIIGATIKETQGQHMK
jgi:hypothetical protein